jgi:pimeloyl-ACP methyl ester carboxylesterase
MKTLIIIITILFMSANQIVSAQQTGEYANVNGIKMYYEIHGSGEPLVLIHGGGSTIRTTFSKVLPLFARNHKVIAVELQAHGHTSDRDAPESFGQDADDVAELLKQLGTGKADILGFSNGGSTTLQIAIRHPELVRRLVAASAFYKREGMFPWFWEGMMKARFEDMPQVYKDEYLSITHSPERLHNMYEKDSRRMQTFKDWKDEDLKSIKVPALVVVADRDVMKVEHAVTMSQLLPHGRLAVLPGTHGSYLGEIMSPDPDSKVPGLFVAMVEEFLGAAEEKK